jgi:hypothetical protein
VHAQAEDLAGRRKKDRGIRIRGGPRRRATAAGAAGAIALLALTGCAKMDNALDKQWMVVSFSPTTSVATALHVRAACSHIQNTPPLALPPGKHSVINIMYGVRYDTTNSSPANLSQLQTCLQKFASVQGVDPEDTGDEGS